MAKKKHFRRYLVRAHLFKLVMPQRSKLRCARNGSNILILSAVIYLLYLSSVVLREEANKTRDFNNMVILTRNEKGILLSTTDKYGLQNYLRNKKERNQSGEMVTTSINKKLERKGQKIKSTKQFKAFSYPLNINFQEVIANYTQGKKINAPVINPHPFETIYEPEVCRDTESTKSKLLIIVKSSAPNGMLRNAIRHTWGANLSEIGVELYFSVGLARKEQVNKDVNVEQEQYRDILLEDFYESYFNVTYKTIMSLNWAVKHCIHIPNFLYIDDDYLINVRSILEYIKTLSPEDATDLYTGFLYNSPVPSRNKKSKWYVSYKDYPYSHFMPYITGGASLLSNYAAHKLVIAFPYVKPMTIDDAWLGIVAKKLDLQLTHNPAFKPTLKVAIGELTKNNFLASHGFKDPEKMFNAYNEIFVKL